MKSYHHLALLLLMTAGLFSCRKESAETVPAAQHAHRSRPFYAKSVYTGFPETFETGTKTAYAPADITLSTGQWNFSDALLGSLAGDHRNGGKCVRLQNSGSITMLFNLSSGASKVSIVHAKYGSDAASSWSLRYSTDGGTNWTAVDTVSTTSASVDTVTFLMSISGNVRFQVKKINGGRLNIDDFSVTSEDSVIVNPQVPTRDDNMAMGNPSNAIASISDPNNYLLQRSQYVLSYNSSKGIPNWVSWHLSSAWKGNALRCDCFKADNSLPTGFFKATTSDYTNTGFNRGHMCPSEDRDGNSADNEATFYMTNIAPQSPVLNQQTWGSLESYCRALMTQGNELYIIAGSYGQGGVNDAGGTYTSIAGGNITVPSHYWKIVVVLPVDTGDVARVSTTTRVIAVDMPNTQTVNGQSWGYYRTSVDALETLTGYDFLSNVPAAVQNVIEAQVDVL